MFGPEIDGFGYGYYYVNAPVISGSNRLKIRTTHVGYFRVFNGNGKEDRVGANAPSGVRHKLYTNSTDSKRNCSNRNNNRHNLRGSTCEEQVGFSSDTCSEVVESLC